jgi:hypothetical protein
VSLGIVVAFVGVQLVLMRRFLAGVTPRAASCTAASACRSTSSA